MDIFFRFLKQVGTAIYCAVAFALIALSVVAPVWAAIYIVWEDGFEGALFLLLLYLSPLLGLVICGLFIGAVCWVLTLLATLLGPNDHALPSVPEILRMPWDGVVKPCLWFLKVMLLLGLNGLWKATWWTWWYAWGRNHWNRGRT